MGRHCSLIRSLAGAAMLVVAFATASAQSSDCSAALSPGDAAAIRGVIEAYRASWLRGDEKGVLATLAPDAVLLPAHGASAVVGTAAIRSYWFPPGAAPTTITKLEITTEGLSGDCRIAYVHGRDDVSWSTVENGVTKKYGHPGTYLNVMTKMSDGSWRIARHMWDDGAPR
jgi:uncharacterized protein (TIGR02246 family)